MYDHSMTPSDEIRTTYSLPGGLGPRLVPLPAGTLPPGKACTGQRVVRWMGRDYRWPTSRVKSVVRLGAWTMKSLPAIDIDRAKPDARTRLAHRAHNATLLYGIAIASGAALVLGLARLGTPSLWVEESFTARAVNGSVFDLFDGYHGLYHSIEKPASPRRDVGGGAPVPVGHRRDARVRPSRRARPQGVRPVVALVSGLLLAASPFVVQWRAGRVATRCSSP